MALQIAGQTTHFIVRYDDAVGAPALAVANTVLRICEADLRTLSLYMPFMRGGAGDPFTHPTIDIQIANNPVNGPGFSSADNDGQFPGRQSRIRINPFSAPNTQITDDFAGFLFVAEMSEILMSFYGWDAGSSQGEALSRVMAEVLHPASTSNFVNGWLSFRRPRPDWISRNEPNDNGVFPRGDTDSIAFGCGIIFIYFLRYQLGFSYDQICMAGGTLLSDRYRNLTGAADDPAARLNQLLDSHFGTGSVNLVSNNPFPLFEGAGRRVFLAFSKPAITTFNLPESGHAHVKPFFTCPAADYPYTELGSNVTETITATTLGIGIPTFSWRVNGKLLPSNSGLGETVSTPVDIPDPQNPEQPAHQTRTFTFDYTITQSFGASGGSSSLTITSRSLDGDYQFEIEADADETAVPTGVVTAQQGLKMHTRTIDYGGTYHADQQRCERDFEKAVGGRVRVVQAVVAVFRNLPDPPPPDYLQTVLEAAGRIHQEIAHIAATDHATATKIAHYAAIQLGVPAHVFLKGARAVAPSA